MPLSRYLIRNEYASSDPEVYLQADKDDPEALLEGVSMAGLVGILRQLGDLSEFAAEIFRDLHEEVLATASRGHGLMVRVEQLENEFPLIEKALLSQTNHSSFFYGAGVDWHPSMRSQANLIAQGELPRYIMDSYEECRGPPRLLFLDKFDVAGAGACLKRYTDPALFKEGTALEDTQREKKVRRVKSCQMHASDDKWYRDVLINNYARDFDQKKGMRGKNGETPESVRMPHAKQHQLFLQGRVEISNSNPSQIVKLKKRQFNESSFCSKNGKGYMEKFVDSPYPDSKTVFIDPVARPALQWTSDGNVPEAIDILSLSPTEIGSRLMDNGSPSIRQTFSEKSSFENLDEMIINEKKMVESAPPPDEVAYEIFDVHDVREMQLAQMTGRMGNGVDGFRSDEITSEIENYADAVATLESEVDAESELEAKTSKRFYNARKHETDSITTDDQVEHQFQFSDSQSWDYSVSDDGNTFVRKGSSTFSYSDGQSNLIENILSDSEGVVCRALPSSEAGTSEYVLDNQIPTKENMLQETSDKLMMPASLKEEAIYTNPLSTDRNNNLFPNDFRENYDHAFLSDVPSENREECLSRLTTENHLTNVEEDEESTVSSDLLKHRSSSLDLPYVAESDTSHTRRPFNSDEGGELIYDEKCKSGLSFAEMSREHPLHTSGLPEITDSSGFTLFRHGSPSSIAIDVDVDRPCSTVVSEDVPHVAEPNSEHCAAREDILHIESKEQDRSLSVDAPINEQNATIDHCHDDERKLDENLHASRAVGDVRLAWKKQIDVSAISRDSCSTTSDDHLASLDDVDIKPPAKVTSGAILSACNESITCTESTAVDAVSISYPEFVGPGPATSYETDEEDTTDSCDVTNEEEVSQEEQCPSQSDLKSHVDFKFEKDERHSSLLGESLVISDSQGNWLPNKELEDKPTCESDLLSSSESNLSPVDYQEVEHGVRSERPPEFRADAPSAKFHNKDETSFESICQPPQQMQSFNLMCHEDILSKLGPTGESSFELGNHKLDGEFLKDSKLISSLPGPRSDIVQPSDCMIEDKGRETSKSYADDQWSQFPCSKPSEQPLLPQVRQTKPDQALFSGVSTGVYQEYMPPTFPVDPPVHSIEDGGCLKSSSPTVVDQSPAPDYMSRASPVSSQTQVWNSVTVVHREDSVEKGSEQVSDPKTLQHIVNPAENILPYLDLEKEKVQSALLPAERLIDCPSGQPATSTFPGELPATSSESSSVFEGTNWPLVCRTSEAENGGLTGGSSHSKMRQNERLGHGLSCLEGEAASVSPEESDVAEPVPSNIARPPKRLIEAVAAHDRSMLRKVTERLLPPVQPTVSGDSFLEQIRTKSFNLKPAVATRPSIQGPKTNLKVAAILEKANTLRQACAGSDEDDDDSWSDS